MAKRTKSKSTKGRKGKAQDKQPTLAPAIAKKKTKKQLEEEKSALERQELLNAREAERQRQEQSALVLANQEILNAERQLVLRQEENSALALARQARLNAREAEKLRQRCDYSKEKREENSSQGRAPCVQCGRNVGRRSTAKVKPYKCHVNCPQKKVFCSTDCQVINGHECLFYGYFVKEEGNRAAEPELQVSNAMQAGQLVAEIPIIVKIPRVSYSENFDKGGYPQIGLPCIQCGVLQDQFISGRLIGPTTTHPDLSIINATNYVPHLMVVENEPVALLRTGLAKCCKKCEWPLCDGCRKGRGHSLDCYELAQVNKMRKKENLEHPLQKNPDYAMFFLGFTRVFQLKKGNCEEYLQFENFSQERITKHYRLPVYETAYLRVFLQEFAPYLKFIGLSDKELSDIGETLLYFRVDSNVVSWGDTSFGGCWPGNIDALAPAIQKSEYLFLGVKLQFGCRPNLVLVKSGKEERVMMKLLRPVKKGDLLSLELYIGRDACRDNIFDMNCLGYGDLTYERGKDRAHRKCTTSTCSVCVFHPGGLLSKEMTDFLTIARIGCKNCRHDRAFPPRHVRRAANRKILAWTCTDCSEARVLEQRIQELTAGAEAFLNQAMADTTSGVDQDAKYRSNPFLNLQTVQKLCPAEHVFYLLGVVNYAHWRIIRMLLTPEQAQCNFFSHSTVVFICDTFLQLLEPYDSFAFRSEAVRAKMVKIMSWVVLGKDEALATAEDVKRKENELVEVINEVDTISGQRYHPSIYDALIRAAQARLNNESRALRQ